MNPNDHPNQRDEFEEEQEPLIPDEKFEESTDIDDNGIADLNDSFIEVEENWSRPQKEAETGSSGGLEAPDSREHIASERENNHSIAIAENIQDEEEDHKVLETIETLQGDSIINQENLSHQLENAGMALELFGVELPNEPMKEADSFIVENEVKEENILELNIKMSETIDNVEENYQEYKEPVDKNELEEPENSPNHSEDESEELLDVTEMIDHLTSPNEVVEEISLKEPHTFSTQIESNLETLVQMPEITDKEDETETNQEKTEEQETEIPVLAIALDSIDIEATSEPVMEVDRCNAENVRKNEGILEMNIKVEESTTKHANAKKENELTTLVYNDQEKKGNQTFADSNGPAEEIIDNIQVAPLHEQEKNLSYEFLNGLTEIDQLKEPVTEFEIINVQPEKKNLEDVNEEATEQEDKMSETNQLEIEAKEPEAIMSVAFIPERIDEPIEFIDSETLEVTQDNEQPTAMSEETLKEALFSLNEEKFITHEKSPTQLDELKVELVPVVPPRPLQSLGASSPQLATALGDNVEPQGASADSKKSPERSGSKKPEWMRKSLMRKGSVRRLFGRMKSKRFNHDRLPVTPPLQPTAPQRPLRQIIVDFLLLLFES